MDYIEADGFILRDPGGRARALLSTTPDGTVSLQLFDRQESMRLALRVTGDGEPQVQLYNAKGQCLSELKVVGEDVAGLVLGSSQLDAMASLTVTPGFVHFTLGDGDSTAVNLSLIGEIANLSLCHATGTGITFDVFANGETLVRGLS